MGKADIVEFALGAALLVQPQHAVPLALATAGMQLVRKLRPGSGQQERSEAARAKARAAGQVHLQWRGIHCSLDNKKGKKKLLKGLSGEARPGRLLSIMGPSGSGKTTLLNALAGQVPLTKGMALQGSVTANGVPLQEAGVQQGYVQQDDLFFSQLTVRETLSLAAQLRLSGTKGSSEDRQQAVEDLIQRLGLSSSADTIVGNAKTRGLSGGEKKRLAIACELIGQPRLLFLDEPTTGLDSFQAEKVMAALKQLAQEGHTVVCSIHQPRSSIYAMFDDLILLSEGACLYSGPADKALQHFEQLGHKCPERHNPAEFLADLISVDYASSDAQTSSRQRVEGLLDHAKLAEPSATAQEASAEPSGRSEEADVQHIPPAGRVPLGKQSLLLFRRAWLQNLRDKATNVSRAMSNVSSAAIFGSIFWRLGRSQASVQNRMGLLQVCAVNCAMSSLTKTLSVFPTERIIVGRERAKGSYQAAPYFLAKLAAESPVSALFPALFGAIVYPACGLHQRASRFARFLGILTLESFTASALGLAVGSVAPSPDAAQAIGPAVAVLFIVFGGYYVNSATVPRALRWVPSASLIQHGFQGLCVNEFKGLDFEGDDGGKLRQGQVANGEQALERLTFQQLSVRSTCIGQARVLAFFYWFTYTRLKSAKPRFQPMSVAS